MLTAIQTMFALLLLALGFVAVFLILSLLKEL